MTYATIVQQMPADLQIPMLELVETLQQDMRAQYAVRREEFDALRAAVTDLAVAQRHTEQHIDRLEAATLALAAAQQRTEQRIEELAAAQQRTEGILQKLVIRVGKNTGKILEIDYRDKAFAYFGTLLRKVKVVSLQDLEPVFEQHLSEAEISALVPLDLLVSGQLRRSDQPDDVVYLAVEVSAVIDNNDVVRAQQRAALLRRAGYRTVAAVAGEEITEGALTSAAARSVLVVQDGLKQNWDEALALA